MWLWKQIYSWWSTSILFCVKIRSITMSSSIPIPWDSLSPTQFSVWLFRMCSDHKWWLCFLFFDPWSYAVQEFIHRWQWHSFMCFMCYWSNGMSPWWAYIRVIFRMFHKALKETSTFFPMIMSTPVFLSDDECGWNRKGKEGETS